MRRALLLLAAALGVAASLPAQQVTARVGGELTATQYNRVLVPITVDMSASGGARLGSYTARLTWNPAVLSFYPQYGSGQQDSSLLGNFPAPTLNTDSAYYDGVLRFTAVSPPGVSGLVTVAQLPFYVNDTTSTALQLSFSEMSAAGTFQNLLPILTVQGATFCGSRGRWGDLDRDGQSNSRDALFVLSHVVGLPVDTLIADTSVADVDADGRTTSRDALVILSYTVGLPITGQRVLLPVASASCATGSARQVAVLPSAIDLVVGQTYRLLAQSTDSAGRSVSLAAVNWRSSDFSVAGVETDGTVTPRAPGTATITAEIGPGVTASATVTVIARRPNWYVAMAATGSPVQNGSAIHPYEHPTQAFPWVAEGDTVRVTAGTYYWSDNNYYAGQLSAGVVILGGTPGDTTTRPVFRGPPPSEGSSTGLWLRGGQRTVVRNVVLQGFDPGIALDGVRNLVVEDTKFGWGPNTSGYGIYHSWNDCAAEMDTVRIDRSVFLGDSASRGGTALYYGSCGNIAAHVTLFRDSKVRFMGDGLYLDGADSIAVLRSEISDNDGYGIVAYYAYDANPARNPSLYVAHSRIERNYYEAIYGYYYRRLVVDSSVIRSTEDDAIDVEGDSPLMQLYLRGDSIYMEHYADDYYWLYASSADSAIIDRTIVRFPADTGSFWAYGQVYANNARVTNSKFLNAAAGTVFEFDGRQFFADSVTMTGCRVASCDRAYGFDLYLDGSGASSSVRRSSFSQIYQPVYLYGTGSVHEVRNVTIDSAYTGVYAYNVDSVAVTDNTMGRVYYRGLNLNNRSGARGPSLVARNAITCATRQPSQAGVSAYSFGVVVDQDTVTGCRIGVDLSSVTPGTRVRRSTLRSNSYGVYLYQYGDSLLIRVDSTGISGSDTVAVLVDQGRASLFHNRIENDSDGVVVNDFFGYVSQLHDNAFVNNTGWSIISGTDSVDASANYWGPSGGPPPTTQPNGVSGRINSSGELSTPPPNLPGLAPPGFLVASVAATTAAPPATRREAPPTRVRAARVRPVLAPAAAPNRSPEQVVQIEAGRQRREAQEARRAEREARVTAERAVLRAAREAQRASSATPATRPND